MRNMIKIGDKIRIKRGIDNENYTKWIGKTLIVEHVAHSVDEHPGYDESMGKIALVSCEDFPFSLYTWEFNKVYR